MEQGSGVSLPDLLSACLRGLERRIVDRKIRIVRQIDPTTPGIGADEPSLRAVVETLLAEAAAGTQDGGRVRVCLKHSPGSLMISIKDQGEGMQEGEWESRLADASREKPQGAPLTLAQCKESVTKMGGNFFANTTLKKGSTYYVVLPLPAVR